MDQLHHNDGVNPASILVVDDDEDTCALLNAIFRTKGFCVESVTSGERAIEYIETKQPDVVVLDIMMPGLNGWDTFTAIRLHSGVPVLFLTASASGDAAAHALTLEGSDFMHKPFTNQELVARAEALIKSFSGRHQYLPTGYNTFCPEVAITVVIPAYNETRFIGSTVLKAKTYAETVIVVDDGSSDNTAEVAEAAGATVVQHRQNQGKGAALNTGFCKARELGAQVVVTLDADGQHLPEEMAQVVKPVLAGEADIVIGSRYIQYHSNVPRHRILGHWFFNKFTHLTSGVATTDSQSGYRAFSVAAIENICFSSQGFSVESEMQFIAHEKGLRLVEVPITILYTDKPKRSVISQGLHVLGGIIKIMGQYRPLFYFGLPGSVLMMLGLLWGLVMISHYQNGNQLAVQDILISLLFTIVGVVLFSTGFTLHSIRGLLIEILKLKK